MCGINGFNFSDKELIIKMKDLTKKRGPDAEGIYLNENVSLAHNRLSILDLSKEANQSMKFQNLVITYNGEIYNYKDLQKELIRLGYKFKTNSDTEVILKKLI